MEHRPLCVVSFVRLPCFFFFFDFLSVKKSHVLKFTFPPPSPPLQGTFGISDSAVAAAAFRPEKPVWRGLEKLWNFKL